MELKSQRKYDLTDFWAAANNGNLPTVSFLKAPGYQDGHATYSDPLAEQTFLVNTINQLQKLSQWKNMAIIITYDDSDGWYDHVMSPIVNQSQTDEDALTGDGRCGASVPSDGFQGRCGYGPRLPLVIISPFAKENFVDHSITDQSSILRFIEDNWNLPQIDDSFDAKAGSLLNMFDFGNGRPNHSLILDPATGQPKHN